MKTQKELTRQLLGARRASDKLQDGWSHDLLHTTQKEYDALALEGTPPDRPLSTIEYANLRKDFFAVIPRHIDTSRCLEGQIDTRPECALCRRLYNAFYSDPPCGK